MPSYIIVGSRPPTDAEVQSYRISNSIADDIPAIRLPNGHVIFARLEDVARINPQFAQMNAAEQQDFLMTGPGGVQLHIPLQPITQEIPDPPQPPTPVVLPPPVPAPTPSTVETTTVPSVALSNFIRTSTTSINRSYRKNSMAAIDSEMLTVQNISQDLAISLTFAGIPGVAFTPSGLTLQPQETNQVRVDFDTAIIQGLQEGRSAAKIGMGISAQLSFTQTPAPRIIPEPPPTIPDPPPQWEGPWEKPIIPVNIDPVIPDVPPILPPIGGWTEIPIIRPVPADDGPLHPRDPNGPQDGPIGTGPSLPTRPEIPFPTGDGGDAPPIEDEPWLPPEPTPIEPQGPVDDPTQPNQPFDNTPPAPEDPWYLPPSIPTPEPEPFGDGGTGGFTGGGGFDEGGDEFGNTRIDYEI